jgi:hypothetical protein
MATNDTGGLGALPDTEDINSPIEIWSRYPGLTDSKLFHEYATRLTAGRDINVFITAASETGVGKTTLAIVLALLWDMHGWTADKATLSPREYDVLYDEVPEGSVLLLDEAEKAVDTRRATSKENVTLSQSFAGKRYLQVAGIMTAPSKSWVDDRLGSDACDYWIQCLETPEGRAKGEAKVYRLRENEHYESEYTKRTETISWPILDGHPAKQSLDYKKEHRFSTDTEDNYVPRSEYEDLKENYWNKCSKKARFHIVRAMHEWTGKNGESLGQQDIADILSAADEVEGVGQSRVSQLVNADSFEDVYS